MESSSSGSARVLVVAHKTATTQPLLDAVSERAQRGPCSFTLLVPSTAHGLHKVVDPQDQGASEAQTVVDQAVPALHEASGMPVEGIVGDADPVAAVQDVINLHGPFDEAIVSTLSARLSRWLRLDLPSKVAGMGLPVTTVTPKEAAKAAV
jgi:hypothetical protein